MFSGTFREAEDEAKRSDKLILACVLDNSEFDSHRMVRDTWKDENVKNFVRDNVVFLMFYRDTSAGATFLSFYPAMEFPYTALVDASTGELAQDWTGFVEPDVLLARISDVVISRSIEASSGAAVRSSVQPDPTGSSSRGSSGHDEDMELDGTDTDLLAQASAYGDDDEALAKAIAASLQDQDAEDLVADRQRADDSGSLGIVGDGKDDAGFRYRVQPRRKRRNAPKPSRTETGAGDEVLARALETREIRMEQDRALREAMEQDRKRDEERAAAAAQAAAAQEERERAAREEAEAREREARAETEAREREAREQAARAKEASAALPPEPDATVEGVVDIAIRLPSGERIRRRFAADHKIGDVLAFAASHGHSVAGRELVTPHPITRFSDPNVRIEDAQLGSRALLILREAP